MDKIKIWYLDSVFVVTNYALIAGLISDKHHRRRYAELLCSKIILKGAYKPSRICRLLPKLKPAA